MSSYNPDNLTERYELGKMLYLAIIRVRGADSGDLDHFETMWLLMPWQMKRDYQQAAEEFRRMVK